MATTNQMAKVASQAQEIFAWAYEQPERVNLYFKTFLGRISKEPSMEFTMTFPIPKEVKENGSKPKDCEGFDFYGAKFVTTDWSEMLDFVAWLKRIEKKIPVRFLRAKAVKEEGEESGDEE